jgi:hypothetical protein
LLERCQTPAHDARESGGTRGKIKPHHILNDVGRWRPEADTCAGWRVGDGEGGPAARGGCA